MPDLWERRLERAARLEKERPAAAPALRFFRELTLLQRDVARLVADPAIHCALDDGDVGPLLPPAMKLFDLVQEWGPPELAAEAAALERATDGERRGLLLEFLRRPSELDPARAFFPRILLQPRAMLASGDGPEGDPQLAQGRCPRCGGLPLASVLRGSSRFLACSFCGKEWSFPPEICPRCLDARRSAFETKGIDGVRVEGCKACRGYLKSIDTGVIPDAEPAVEVVATEELDRLARERGFRNQGKPQRP